MCTPRESLILLIQLVPSGYNTHIHTQTRAPGKRERERDSGDTPTEPQELQLLFYWATQLCGVVVSWGTWQRWMLIQRLTGQQQYRPVKAVATVGRRGWDCSFQKIYFTVRDWSTVKGRGSHKSVWDDKGHLLPRDLSLRLRLQA